MGEVRWLRDAVDTCDDPEVKIMEPDRLDYDLVEAPIRALVLALNLSGCVETLSSCGGHPETSAWYEGRRYASAYVMLHVLDGAAFQRLAGGVALLHHRIPGLEIGLYTDDGHEACLYFRAARGPATAVRRRLDRGFNLVVQALDGNPRTSVA